MQFVMQKVRKDMTWTNCKVPYDKDPQEKPFSPERCCILTLCACEPATAVETMHWKRSVSSLSL